jgi:hypothetical protein
METQNLQKWDKMTIDNNLRLRGYAMSRKLVKQNFRGMAALVTALMLVVSGAAMAQSTAGAQAPIQIIGHRGAAGLAPENTLAAFTKAMDLGVDGLEMDVLLCADGEIVVHHDFGLKPEIARTPGGKWCAGSDGKWSGRDGT